MDKEVISMANKGNVLRRIVNENVGLVFLVILICLFLVGQAVITYFQFEDIELEIVAIMLLLIFGSGSAFSAICEAIFRQKY